MLRFPFLRRHASPRCVEHLQPLISLRGEHHDGEVDQRLECWAILGRTREADVTCERQLEGHEFQLDESVQKRFGRSTPDRFQLFPGFRSG